MKSERFDFLSAELGIERASKCRASDTAAQREVRLAKRHSHQRGTYASLSGERKQARIETVTSAQHERIAAESLEERAARLQQLSAQGEKIAHESMEEREVRLQRVMSSQEERIARKSTEERGPSSTGQEERIAHEFTKEREAHSQ